MMPTIMLSPSQVKAVGQLSLCANAIHVVQKDGPTAVAEVAQHGSPNGCAAAHLAAYNLCVGVIPVIITNGSPEVPIKDFHSTLAAAVPVGQAYAATCWSEWEKEETGTDIKNDNL